MFLLYNNEFLFHARSELGVFVMEEKAWVSNEGMFYVGFMSKVSVCKLVWMYMETVVWLLHVLCEKKPMLSSNLCLIIKKIKSIGFDWWLAYSAQLEVNKNCELERILQAKNSKESAMWGLCKEKNQLLLDLYHQLKSKF